MPQRLLRTALGKASQCLRECFGRPITPSHLVLRDCFGKGVTVPQRLTLFLFLWPSETAFWHPQMLLTLRSASSSASETASEKASQCLRDCFGRPLTPSHLVPCPHSVFMWPSETAFWHPQMLLTLRSASSSASETASEGLSRVSPCALPALRFCFYDRPKHCFGRPLTPLTSCLARTLFLFLWPSETAFWHPQMLLTLRSASSSASETASEKASQRHFLDLDSTTIKKGSAAPGR